MEALHEEVDVDEVDDLVEDRPCEAVVLDDDSLEVEVLRFESAGVEVARSLTPVQGLSSDQGVDRGSSLVDGSVNVTIDYD